MPGLATELPQYIKNTSRIGKARQCRGQLLEELTIEKVISGNYRSHLRNKQIANMFKEAGLIEKYGSGIKRVIETCKKWGMLTPIFECTEKGFLVTVFKSDNREKVGEKVGEKYSENQKLIIKYIQENNTISAKDLSDRVGISSRKVEENIKKLKQVGKLRRIGPNKGGYWQVLE